MSGDRRIKLSLPDDDLEALKEIARKRGVPLSALVREAVRRMVEREGGEEELRLLIRQEVMELTEGSEARVMRALDLLMRQLSELRERVSSVEAKLDELLSQGVDLHPRVRKVGHVTSEVEGATGREFSGLELPSFLRDNPWTEILSKKGRS